jgi:hypothetical protein
MLQSALFSTQFMLLYGIEGNKAFINGLDDDLIREPRAHFGCPFSDVSPMVELEAL